LLKNLKLHSNCSQKDWQKTKLLFCVAKSNFRLSGAKLFFDYNLPYKFLAEKGDFENWGSPWDNILTYFKGNP